MRQENISEESVKVSIETSLKIERDRIEFDKIEVIARISGSGPNKSLGTDVLKDGNRPYRILSIYSFPVLLCISNAITNIKLGKLRKCLIEYFYVRY